MTEIKLDFKGYRLEQSKNGIEDYSGIYCVYSCKYSETDDTVNIRKLLYIGKAKNLNERINGHERLESWERYLNPGETLCYSRAKIGDQQDRARAEAALIYKHKPPCNDDYTDSFPFPDTRIELTGKTAELVDTFTVRDTR